MDLDAESPTMISYNMFFRGTTTCSTDCLWIQFSFLFLRLIGGWQLVPLYFYVYFGKKKLLANCIVIVVESMLIVIRVWYDRFYEHWRMGVKSFIVFNDIIVRIHGSNFSIGWWRSPNYCLSFFNVAMPITFFN